MELKSMDKKELIKACEELMETNKQLEQKIKELESVEAIGNNELVVSKDDIKALMKAYRDLDSKRAFVVPDHRLMFSNLGIILQRLMLEV